MQHIRYPIFERIGKMLHAQLEDIAREPLPQRWTDLIDYLADRERQHGASAGPGEPAKLRPVRT